MILSNYDLKQIDQDYLGTIPRLLAPMWLKIGQTNDVYFGLIEGLWGKPLHSNLSFPYKPERLI